MNELDEKTVNDDLKRYSITLGLDREKFLRRTCEACGLDFKTRADDADLGWLLAKEVERTSDFTATPQSEGENKLSSLTCPYCQNKSSSSEMHTEETMAYIRRFAFREIVEPMLDKQFSELASAFGTPKGGLISLSMSYSRGVRKIRPSHGPEPPDMCIIDLLCCGEQIKILENWMSIEVCPFCNEQIKLY